MEQELGTEMNQTQIFDVTGIEILHFGYSWEWPKLPKTKFKFDSSRSIQMIPSPRTIIPTGPANIYLF